MATSQSFLLLFAHPESGLATATGSWAKPGPGRAQSAHRHAPSPSPLAHSGISRISYFHGFSISPPNVMNVRGEAQCVETTAAAMNGTHRDRPLLANKLNLVPCQPTKHNDPAHCSIKLEHAPLNTRTTIFRCLKGLKPPSPEQYGWRSNSPPSATLHAKTEQTRKRSSRKKKKEEEEEEKNGSALF